MKKKLAMVLLATALMLTACGNDDTKTDANPSQTTQSQTEESQPESSQAEPGSTEGTAAPEGTDGSTAGNEEGYVPGVFTETGYESEYLGYRFTTPEGFTLQTQEELATLMGMSMEILSQDYSEAQLAYAQKAVIYDLMASNETGTNVNIVLQQLDTTGLTLELLAETMMQQMGSLTSMECVVSDSYEIVDFAGAEYAKYSATVTSQGVTMNQEYYVGMKPDRVVNFTFTYLDGEEAQRDALVSAFAAY